MLRDLLHAKLVLLLRHRSGNLLVYVAALLVASFWGF